MEADVQKSPQKHGRRNTILISLVIFSMLMLAVAAQLTYMTLKNDKVYNGIQINEVNVSGMSKTELLACLEKQYMDKVKKQEITLHTDHITEKANFSDIKVSYDTASAAEKAYAIGRTGNIFDRIYDIIYSEIKGVVIDMPLSYSKDLLDGFVTTFYEKTLIKVKETDVFIQDDKVTIRSGHHGENIDKSSTLSKAEALIKECRGGTVSADVTVTPQSKLNIDDLYKQVNREPLDAGFKIKNGNVNIIPQVTGRKIEKDVLLQAATELEKTENLEKVIPVQLITPLITTEDAYARVFNDKLSTMSTHFTTSTLNDKNRGENIKIAVAKIDGKILAPGEIFSFNDAVGPRTEDGGYQKAHTYTAGKVVDGIGGGICQVSTTLYNAVLKADLQVLERRNHMFTVGYVPFGQDATVSYGTTDFKFSNSTKWPIKIEAGVTKNNNVFFTFMGTNENPGKSVIITTQTLKKTPFTTKYTDDPTLPEGKTEIKQIGKEGFVVDTFKTIKQDGKVISQVKLHTSVYMPLEEEILKGTKKTVPAVPATPATTPAATSDTPAGKPVQPSTGVDDADNPPAQEAD